MWPGPAVLGWLRALDRPNRVGLRWTTEAQWHVTLRFLGRLDEEDEVRLRDRLSTVASGCPEVLARAGPRPEALRAGVWVLPVAGLQSLAGAIERATADIGQPAPPRSFRGHLTLARARHPGELTDLTAPDLHEAWGVGEITLVRSTLDPAGARDDVVGRWLLEGPERAGSPGPG